MSVTSYEIRICTDCGLRFPVTNEQKTGTRCPHCLGETKTRGLFPLSGDAPPNIKTKRRTNCAVLLDNIRSAWNVGSILRTADGFGFNHAFLCGITPTPEVDAVRKTALGVDVELPWSYHNNAIRLAADLINDGWVIWGLEEMRGAQPISSIQDGSQKNNRRRIKTVLVLGSEVTGMDPELLTICEKVFMIPMGGVKRSFNVAVAFGIAAYALSGK